MCRSKLFIKTAALILSLAIVFSGCAAEKENYNLDGVTPAVIEVVEKDGDTFYNFEPFLRIDCDSSEAWNAEIENLRVLTEGMYELGEAKEKYNLDMDYPLSLEGFDSLNISGSAQFSEKQFRELAEILREAAGDKKIVIVDLREESHVLLNGISISLFSKHNWVNLGLDLDTIEKNEAEVFGSLAGETVRAFVEDDDLKTEDYLDITVESVMTEKELAESEGFEYFRLDCTDHAWPTDAEIDAFIEFVKENGTEDTWYHFHCHAGKGRTGVFMTLYDKMKNPGLPMQDILYRHAMTGSNYPIYYGDEDSYKVPLYAEKAEMTPYLFRYVDENHESNYEVSWSEWISENK